MTFKASLFTLLLFSRLKGRPKQEALKSSEHNALLMHVVEVNKTKKKIFLMLHFKITGSWLLPTQKTSNLHGEVEIEQFLF